MTTNSSPMHPDAAKIRLLHRAFGLPVRWRTTRMTHSRIQNFCQAQLEQIHGAVHLSSLPIKLTIESTNICNLRCVACPTGVERHGRQRGHMSLELFDWLMRELGPTLLEVELHNWGEPLLGRNVLGFIDRATAAGVASSMSTNFSIPFDEERAERLVTSGLSALGVSIDGATQHNYEKYRVRGDLARVLDNCRLVASAKRRLQSPTPELFFSYHVFSHNVHEVETARRIAEEIGMKFVASRGWVVGPADERTAGFPYIWGNGFPSRCHFLWFQAVVHHDGGVAPCCGTFYAEDDFDVLKLDRASLDNTSFRTIWNGPKFIAARQLFDARAGGERTRRLACFDCPETVNFEGWKEALRTQVREFSQISSNEMYNFFWNRKPGEGSGLVRLRRSASSA